eukprot:scaffold197909_cov33-Tisochrysis_lutea.AAC.1
MSLPPAITAKVKGARTTHGGRAVTPAHACSEKFLHMHADDRPSASPPAATRLRLHILRA